MGAQRFATYNPWLRASQWHCVNHEAVSLTVLYHGMMLLLDIAKRKSSECICVGLSKFLL